MSRHKLHRPAFAFPFRVGVWGPLFATAWLVGGQAHSAPGDAPLVREAKRRMSLDDSPTRQPGTARGPSAPLELGELEHRLEILRRSEHSLRRALEKGKSQAEQLQARVIVRGRAYIRATRGMPEGDFFAHAARVERLRHGLLSDLDQLRKVKSKSRGTGRKLSRLEAQRAPLELEQRTLGAATEALLAQNERERAFQMAFSSSRGARLDHTAVYSAGAQIQMNAASFRSMRGRLPFPIPGRTEVERVKLPHAPGPGLILRAAMGAVARAVFAGRVAFASDYSEYGGTVIVDHGHGYFSLTAGLARIDVSVGDEIPAMSRLGLCGEAAGMSKLYFEIRSQTETLDPGRWLGI